jgi:hypothetical protein
MLTPFHCVTKKKSWKCGAVRGFDGDIRKLRFTFEKGESPQISICSFPLSPVNKDLKP